MPNLRCLKMVMYKGQNMLENTFYDIFLQTPPQYESGRVSSESDDARTLFPGFSVALSRDKSRLNHDLRII